MFVNFFKHLLMILLCSCFLIPSIIANELSSNLSDIEKKISLMSLDDKIGQLFFTIIYGENLQDQSKEYIRKTHVGNFLYFKWANKLSSFDQVKNLSNDLKEFVLNEIGIAPFIAVDQEGGRVNWLQEGFTHFPSNREMGQKVPQDDYIKGKVIASELKRAGLNVDLAPVVDLCKDQSYWIFPRTYSDDPLKVISFASEFIKGLHDEKILSTLKHYPGHGKAHGNTHFELPYVDNTFEQLWNEDLKPYIMLAKDTDFIMSVHIFLPKIDSQNAATFSKILLTDILREKIGYQGIIISDSLMMRGAIGPQKNMQELIEKVSKSAISAFLAGCDCMIISKPEWADFNTTEEEDLLLFEAVINNFKRAVNDKIISIERLDQSLKRILKTKQKI